MGVPPAHFVCAFRLRFHVKASSESLSFRLEELIFCFESRRDGSCGVHCHWTASWRAGGALSPTEHHAFISLWYTHVLAGRRRHCPGHHKGFSPRLSIGCNEASRTYIWDGHFWELGGLPSFLTVLEWPSKTLGVVGCRSAFVEFTILTASIHGKESLCFQS